jgi:hypothetical protein
MNSEVKESTRIIKVINEHLAESDCHHNIKSIMQEALEYKSGLGNQPNPADEPVPEPVISNGKKSNV